jgi:repressor LexA
MYLSKFPKMKNTEKLTSREIEALREIRSAIRHLGKFPAVRELMVVMGYRSPRSVSVLLQKLEEKGFLHRDFRGNLQIVEESKIFKNNVETIDVPIVGTAQCGALTFAEQNVEGFVRISTVLAPRNKQHFLLRAEGDSMNEAGIQHGDLVLVRVQNFAENGNRVVALVDDEATIKEFHRRGDVVILQPRSTNSAHQPIIVSENLQIQGVVVTSIPTL